MWCILLALFSIRVLQISALQQNYNDILFNVNDLPKLGQYIQRSPDYANYVAHVIVKSAGLFVRPDNATKTFVDPVYSGLSEQCVNQAVTTTLALFQKQRWAETMIDATGKFPSDVLDGNILWLGDYEECLSVHSNLTLNPLNLKLFNGKYCLVGIPVPGTVNPLTRQGPMIQIGVCVPDGCTEKDTITIFNLALSRLSNHTLLANTSTCQEPDRKFDTRAVTVLVIVSLFITVMVIATMYDIVRTNWPNLKIQKMSVILNGEIEDNYDDEISKEESTPLLRAMITAEPGIFGRLLISFSIYTNAAKILSTSQPTGSLSAVNGIRFISMTWVILGHTFLFLISNGDNILSFLDKMFERWSFQVVQNGLVSVDTFFTLSGLLLTYLTMKELKKREGKLNWFLFYFHRFWRLTPPYMLILMVYVSLFPYIGSGPIWKKDGTEYNYCKDAWYYNFLYINNFISVNDANKQCMVWTWYLANDMQFFIISPVIIIPLFKSIRTGLTLMILFLLGTWITTAVISTHYKLTPNFMFGNPNIGDYYGYYYQRPYCRFGPYLVGMFTGYLLYRMDCKCTIKWYVNLILWITAIGLGLTIVYGLYDEVNGHPMSVEVAALYNTVHRTLWGACVSWVIFACATGNGGFVNSFLSWKVFIPLGRLTYCAYLIHPIIISYYANSIQRPLHFTDLTIIYLYLGNLCLSYAVAFVVSLAFESPMMGLEKVILKRGEQKINRS